MITAPQVMVDMLIELAEGKPRRVSGRQFRAGLKKIGTASPCCLPRWLALIMRACVRVRACACAAVCDDLAIADRQG